MVSRIHRGIVMGVGCALALTTVAAVPASACTTVGLSMVCLSVMTDTIEATHHNPLGGTGELSVAGFRVLCYFGPGDGGFCTTSAAAGHTGICYPMVAKTTGVGGTAIMHDLAGCDQQSSTTWPPV